MQIPLDKEEQGIGYGHQRNSKRDCIGLKGGQEGPHRVKRIWEEGPHRVKERAGGSA